jgi:hypothetical protein
VLRSLGRYEYSSITERSHYKLKAAGDSMIQAADAPILSTSNP